MRLSKASELTGAFFIVSDRTDTGTRARFAIMKAVAHRLRWAFDRGRSS